MHRATTWTIAVIVGVVFAGCTNERSIFDNRNDAVYSPHGTVLPGERAYSARHFAMEMEPAGEGRIGVFGRATGNLLVELAALPEGSTNDLKAMCWGPNGDFIAVMYHGGDRPGITIYDAENGEMHLRIAISRNWHFMLYSASGDELLVSERGNRVDAHIPIPPRTGQVPISISDTEGGRE